MAIIRSGLPNDPESEVEFGYRELDDKVFGPKDLADIKWQIEELEVIEAVNPAVRAIVLRYWPELAHKLPPEDAEPNPL